MEEDDDFGFMPTGKSRLSALFPTTNVSENDVNQSLTYVAPKQPKKNAADNPVNAGSKNLALIHVVTAYTYKLEGGKYVNAGKLGVAMLGNKDAALYKLLLYKGKSQHVAMCTVTVDFQFCIEPNNYAKFPDDKGDHWSVMFGSEKEMITFSKQVALAKANSCGKVPTQLIVQNLIAGDGNSIKMGDYVDLLYTGWLFKNGGFGEEFDENVRKEKPFLVHLGKTKVIKGLLEGLIGVKKHMRRLLIIPPYLAYGSEGSPNLVPPNSTLIFEIYVKKIKLSRDTSGSPSPSRKTSDAKPEVPRRTQSVSEDTIRIRGASISEQLTQSPRKDNAKIISRMAKMGLPTLPMSSNTVESIQTSSESEPEKEPEQPVKRKESASTPNVTNNQVLKDVESREIVHGHRRRNLSAPKQSTSPQMQPLQIPNMPYASYPAYPVESASFVHQPLQPHAITPLMPSVVSNVLDNHIPLLVAETRTQNTEVRLALGKLNDKVDVVLQKLDEGKYRSDSMPSAYSRQVPYMEGAVLLQNIEHIVNENSQLKVDIESKNSKIQELNEKICEILQRNQRFFEESNSILEQRGDSLQTASQLQIQIMNLEKEKVALSAELQKYVSKHENSEARADKYQILYNDLSKKSSVGDSEEQWMNDTLSNLREKCLNSETVIEHLQDKLDEVLRVNDELTRKVMILDDAAKSARESEERLKSQMKALSSEASEESNAEAEMWKKKYEEVYEHARHLKQDYESQISFLTAEVKKLSNSVHMQTLMEHNLPTDYFESEIKKAMNIVYKLLRSEVKQGENFSGAEVLKICLSVIQKVTLSFIEKNQQQQQLSENHDRSTPSRDTARMVEKTDMPRSVPREIAGKQFELSSTSEIYKTPPNEMCTEGVESGSNISLNSVDKVEGSAIEVAGMRGNSCDEPVAHSTKLDVQDKEKNTDSREISNDIKDKNNVQDKNTDIQDKKPDGSTSKNNTDIQDQNNVIQDKNTDIQDKNTDIQDKNTDIQDKNTDIQDRKHDPTSQNNDGDSGDFENAAVVRNENTGSKTPDIWRPQPPPLPLFSDEEEDEDDWLK